jgi:hypothetical protein
MIDSWNYNGFQNDTMSQKFHCIVETDFIKIRKTDMTKHKA